MTMPEPTLVDEILDSARGEVKVRLSEPHRQSLHTLTLARAGVLRHSRAPGTAEETAVHPTSALPGVLLRLAAIAPLGAAPEGSSLDALSSSIEQLFSEDPTTRERAWGYLLESATVLPPVSDPALEAAPPRAVQLVRRRVDGDRRAVLLQVRGRYLIVSEEGSGRFVGADPTDAAREVLRPLLTVRG